MEALIEKLKIFLIPFLIISIVCVCGYTFFNWYFIIERQWLDLDDLTKMFLIPFILPSIAVLIWIRPRVHLLRFKDDKWFSFYEVLAAVFIALPIIWAQQFIETQTGKLTKLDSTSEILKLPKTKYYTLNHFYIAKDSVAFYSNAQVSGKRNEDLYFHIYLATPIFKDSFVTTESPNAWLGLNFTDRVSNNLSEVEKDTAFKKFSESSMAEFEKSDLSKFQYLEYIDDSEDYTEAIKTSSDSADIKNDVILKAINEPFENRSDSAIKWFILSFVGLPIIWFLLLIYPSFDYANLERFKRGRFYFLSPPSDALSFFKMFFIPSGEIFVTTIIVDVNILIYILMLTNNAFNLEGLLHWGANSRPLVLEGQWWRLISSIFLHGGFFHLIMNIAGFVMVSILLESLLGRFKLAFVYIFTGFCASLASIWWNEATLSVGASGAIFGLYGILMSLLLTNRFPSHIKWGIFFSAAYFVVLNLINGLTPGIDNAAHIGGLLSGIIVGFVLAPTLKREY